MGEDTEVNQRGKWNTDSGKEMARKVQGGKEWIAGYYSGRREGVRIAVVIETLPTLLYNSTREEVDVYKHASIALFLLQCGFS